MDFFLKGSKDKKMGGWDELAWETTEVKGLAKSVVAHSGNLCLKCRGENQGFTVTRINYIVTWNQAEKFKTLHGKEKRVKRKKLIYEM